MPWRAFFVTFFTVKESKGGNLVVFKRDILTIKKARTPPCFLLKKLC
jgi:hypothetical protein